MFCGSCGKKIDDDAAFCGYCGAKVHGFEPPAKAAVPAPVAVAGTAPPAPAAPMPAAPVTKPVRSLRGGVTAALILGICALLAAAFDTRAGLICGVLAVVFGALNLKYGKPDRPYCIAGFAAGIAAVILCAVLLLTLGRHPVKLDLFDPAPAHTAPSPLLEDGGTAL